jgi:hypothetical protein
MTAFFYLLTVAFFLYEISVITRSGKHVEFLKKVANKEMWRDEKEVAARGCLWIIFHLFYITWAITGFALSANWKLFGLLFLISVFRMVLMKFSSKTLWKSTVIFVDAVASATVLFTIFMRHFHPEMLLW